MTASAPNQQERNTMVTLYRPEAVQVVEDEGKNRSPLVSIGLITVSAFIGLSIYLTAKQATRTTEVAERNTQNARDISIVSAQLKQQADTLQRFDQANNRILQVLHNTDLQNEERINRIEEATDSLKNSIAQVVGNEARLAKRLDRLAARLPKIPESVPVPVPQPRPTNQASSAPPAVQTIPSNHEHNYIDDAVAPAGTVALNENRQVTWLIQKDGKEQKVRPFEETTLGVLVHNFADGKDYLITPNGEWLGEAY
jgi:hypothetical protein